MIQLQNVDAAYLLSSKDISTLWFSDLCIVLIQMLRFH